MKQVKVKVEKKGYIEEAWVQFLNLNLFPSGVIL